jgi:hypothetical protein
VEGISGRDVAKVSRMRAALKVDGVVKADTLRAVPMIAPGLAQWKLLFLTTSRRR